MNDLYASGNLFECPICKRSFILNDYGKHFRRRHKRLKKIPKLEECVLVRCKKEVIEYSSNLKLLRNSQLNGPLNSQDLKRMNGLKRNPAIVKLL